MLGEGTLLTIESAMLRFGPWLRQSKGNLSSCGYKNRELVGLS